MRTSATYLRTRIKARLFVLMLTMIPLLSGLQGLASDIVLPLPEPEKSVNDIPFDTHEIVVNYHFTRAMANVKLPAESYIDDIPFETSVIAAKIKDLQTSQSEQKKAGPLPDNVMLRLNQLMKAGLITVAVLLTVSVLVFLYFSYVY